MYIGNIKVKVKTSANANAKNNAKTSTIAKNKYYANNALCSFSTTGFASLSLTKKQRLFALAP